MLFRHFGLFLLFLLILGIPDAKSKGVSVLLPPPAWECIQTVGSDVVLNWSVVPDPGGNFVQYEVHSIEDGWIATLPNINTTTYTHVGVNTVKNYFLVVVDNVSGPTSSSTIRNLRLTLNNPNNGTALLNWNSTNFPLGAPPAKPVKVNREYPVGTWSIQDSVTSPTLQYRDTIDICSAFLNYQIIFPGNGCDFTSNTVGDLFTDKIAPNIPTVNTVTIDSTTGLVNISWNQNAQPDTYGYIIYIQNAAGNVVELDTVWGIGNTLYSYLENTSLGPLTYSVAAFDSCFTTSMPATYQTSAKGFVHTSVFLQGYYDPCGSVGVLDWTAYQGWNNVDHYEVYVNPPSGPWTNVVNTTNLQHSEIFTQIGLHEILVVAVHTDGRQSFSNKITLNVATKPAPNINYILSASIVNQEVFIRHLVDTSGNVSSIAFERLRKDGTFYEVGRQSVFLPITVFVDKEANVEEVNVYRAVVVDSCGYLTTISDTVYTTVLTVDEDSINYLNTIQWTPYVGYDGNVQRYDLFRIIDGVVSPGPIASVGPNVMSFVDNVDQEFVRNQMCYFVVAVENTNSYGFAEKANSNLACSEFTPYVYIPNSFTPGGFNPFFTPKYSYMKLPNFEMRIYNRWGEEIFVSNDPISGWDGNLNNSFEPAPNGVYVYSIRFFGIEDKQLMYHGQVNLLR